MQTIKIENWDDDVPKNFTGIAEWLDGSKRWFLNGELHREDGPAIDAVTGTKKWFLNGELHREDGPAVEWANGGKEWWINGERHRADGPAIEYVDGSKQWKVDFTLPSNSLPFIFIEEIDDGRQIKVLTPTGLDIWPNLPGLKQLADNWNRKP